MLDIILVIVFVTTILNGWRKGGMVAVLNLISTIVSIFIACTCRGKITDIAMTTALPKWVMKNLAGKTVKIPAIPFLGQVAVSASNAVVRTIVMIIAMLIVFIILRVIFAIAIHFLNGFLNFISLGSLNRLVGGFLAVVPAYISIYLLVLLTTALAPIFGWVDKLKDSSHLITVIPSPLQIFNIFGKLM